MPFHVPKCECLLRWLSIASGMQIVLEHVPLCVHSLPMPGGSQTWGVNRSLRMGFNDTGSSGRACFKAEAGRISSRTRVHSTRLCPCMHAWNAPSLWMSNRSTGGFILASHSHTITRNNAALRMFWGFLILQSKCQAPQTDTWAKLGVEPGHVKRGDTSAIKLHSLQVPKAASKDLFQNKVWKD